MKRHKKSKMNLIEPFVLFVATIRRTFRLRVRNVYIKASSLKKRVNYV